MKNFVCFALVLAVSTFAYANRSEKLKRVIAKREVVKEQKREIARVKEENKKKKHKSTEGH